MEILVLYYSRKWKNVFEKMCSIFEIPILVNISTLERKLRIVHEI